jgi:hypothetical protein
MYVRYLTSKINLFFVFVMLSLVEACYFIYHLSTPCPSGQAGAQDDIWIIFTGLKATNQLSFGKIQE